MIKARKFALLIGDLALLYLALWLALRLRHLGDYQPEIFLRHLLPFSIVFIIWIIVFFINNLYTVELVKNEFRFYGYLVQNQIINTLIALGFFYIVPSSFTPLKPQTVLLMLIIINTVLLLVWRRIFYSVSSSARIATRVLFIGLNKEVANLIRHIQKRPQLGYAIGLVINIDNEPLPLDLETLPQEKGLINITQHIKDYKIDLIVTTTNPKYTPQVSKYLFDTVNLKMQYYNLPDFYEMMTGKIPIASIEKSWFLENITYGKKRFYEVIKRAEDIAAALIIGTVTLPITIPIALLIKFESKGPLFFNQIRTGKGGKNFKTIKFRSMVNNAEKDGMAVWASKNDSRVTKIGRFIRTSRIDEIPQVINILRGDMSLVGPRPERPEFIQILNQQIPFYNERLLVKPGLTGWAQINYPYGDSIEDAMAKLQYDLFYIKNRSFTLDVSIILKTINTVFDKSMGQ